jgi:hypothetical protein
MIQYTLDQLLNNVTLYDLVSSEKESSKFLSDMLVPRQVIKQVQA